MSTSCWCQSEVPNHSHVMAYRWYMKHVPPSYDDAVPGARAKQEAWYRFATIMYKLGVTITY